MPIAKITSGLSRKARAIWQEQRTAVIDAGIIGLLGGFIYLIAMSHDAFEWLHTFTRTHEHWELDEFLTASIVLTFMLAAFSTRRVFDVRGQIARRRAAEQEARRLTLYDARTGLPNQQMLSNEFESGKAALTSQDKLCAVHVIDLHHFRKVNDAHGHATGDEAILFVAQRLSALAYGKGIVARLDGDKFAILVSFSSGSAKHRRFARRIIRTVSEPMHLGDLSVAVGANVGVALYPGDGETLQELLRSAHLALSNAVNDDRRTISFFKPEVDAMMRKHLILEQQLGCAIGNGEIVPYYQPLVDLASRSTVGYEVLARWNHPERGLLYPDAFIPLAEDTKLLTGLTLALLRRACTDARDWSGGPFLGLNISPSQLQDAWLSREILKILTETGFPAHRLEIEVTEQVLVEEFADVRRELHSLRNVGIHIALDDFGTGYSGLSQLRELPFDKVKIDRSFVQSMESDPESARLAEGIINLSKSLGLGITAEGVESLETSNRLAEMGCHIGQGYLFGKPVSAKEIVLDLTGSREEDRKIA